MANPQVGGGGFNSINIDKADNGFVVNVYNEGTKKQPGKTQRKVATSEKQAMGFVGAALGKKVGRSNRRGWRSRGTATKTKKKKAYKR